MAGTWERLATEYHSSGKKVIIAKVDCTQFKPLCNTHNIGGYPTLLWFFNGKRVSVFSSCCSVLFIDCCWYHNLQPGLWSRESLESQVFSWSRESESVFKTAGVGVGFLKLLESESVFQNCWSQESES